MIYDKISSFYKKYRGRKCVIGYSSEGRCIFAFHVGDGFGRQYIAAYGIHGREWITAELALVHIRRPTSAGGWIIPLVNPDGAVISQTVSPLWKANARGVDLNVNFDAAWGTGRLNTRFRGPQNCIGDRPFSESESHALAQFTKKVGPYVTFSFHTKGEEIYWQFGDGGDERGAAILAAATGYRVKKLVGSAGGYKDWCILDLGIPAYTIECGSDSLSHPIKRVRALRKCYGILRYFTHRYEEQVYGKRP